MSPPPTAAGHAQHGWSVQDKSLRTVRSQSEKISGATKCAEELLEHIAMVCVLGTGRSFVNSRGLRMEEEKD